MRQSPTIGFTLLLMCAALVAFGLTLDLGRVAGLVPRYVVVPTFVLLLIQLAFDCLPGLAERFKPYAQVQLRRTETVQERANVAAGSTAPVTRLRYRELRALGWMLALPVAVLTLGFLFGAPLYVAAYLKGRARIQWAPAIAAAVGSGLVLYAVFFLGLDTALYRGCVWHRLSGFGP